MYMFHGCTFHHQSYWRPASRMETTSLAENEHKVSAGWNPQTVRDRPQYARGCLHVGCLYGSTRVNYNHTGNTLMSAVLQRLNSLAPGKFWLNFRHVICKEILLIDGWGISCEIALIWMSLDFTDDQSTLVQVMAWCRQATSHYLNQCWPRSLPLYGVTIMR